ncbi:hypothetical protein RVR_P2103 (plasmid) [Actinacidiphila reveromycinica]|uniref:Uncharacterized protein n=1 Tax=Actinacidiphila reveromycinica TaxID=659352 RepID=A0A7R6QBR9_9ACTN|nr:hypothetical protein [Streptomyces sp. SN-593]BBG20777.1 hypothetical protein RVR_P2103 [Streptomyces sp. SN-593]
MDVEATRDFPPVHELAEDVLLEWFRRQVAEDPAGAFAAVELLVMAVHEVSCPAVEAAAKAGISWHQIGRALAVLEGSGLLLRQGAALLLGAPAADRAAEQAAFARLVGEERSGDGEDQESGSEWAEPAEEQVWSAAVDRFRANTRASVPIGPAGLPNGGRPGVRGGTVGSAGILAR